MSSVLQKHDMCGTTTNLYNLDIKLLIAAKVFICIIGIPLNAFLAVNIIRLRRLHSKPRNIFLLAIIFSNLFIFIPTIVQLIYLYYPLESLGQFFVFIEGLPLAHLLLNFSIALCVKYAAFRNPLWHRKKVNLPNSIYFLVFCSLSVTCLLKFVYIVGIFPLSCDTRLSNPKKIDEWIIVFFFFFCVAIYSIVFKLSRKLVVSTSYNPPLCSELRYRNSRLPPIHPPFSPPPPCEGSANRQYSRTLGVFQHQNDEALVNIDSNSTANNFFEPTRLFRRDAVETLNTVSGHSRMTIPSRPTNSGIRVLMAKAIHTWVYVATSVIITILPIVLFFLSLSFCEITDNSQCFGILNELEPYFEELIGLIHAVLNPIVWLLLSNELRLLPRQ